MSAVLFGSISTLADTSELQRHAFNQAFESAGLDWEWSRDDYVSMLGSNGGAQRIQDYAESRGENVDAAEVHRLKSKIFQQLLSEATLPARPGVVDVIADAKKNQHKVGFVTTTSRENIDALLSALQPHVSAETFDLILDSDSASAPKPDAAAYEIALERLSEHPESVVAIEDNVGGVAAARSAGIRCIAFPNQNTKDGDFSAANEVVEILDATTVLGLAAS